MVVTSSPPSPSVVGISVWAGAACVVDMTFQANFRTQLDRVTSKYSGRVFWCIFDLFGPPTGAEREPNFEFFFGPDAQGNILENVFEVARSRRNSLHSMILYDFFSVCGLFDPLRRFFFHGRNNLVLRA